MKVFRGSEFKEYGSDWLSIDPYKQSHEFGVDPLAHDSCTHILVRLK